MDISTTMQYLLSCDPVWFQSQPELALLMMLHSQQVPSAYEEIHEDNCSLQCMFHRGSERREKVNTTNLINAMEY